MKTTPNSTPGYTSRPVMVSLSYLAYCGDQITTPNPEPTILQLINQAIPQIPPVASWRVVWGPVAYTTPGALYQDNMMYVAQDTANPTDYAVAVRGTNFVSDLDWLMDDLDVLQMMPWPTVSGASISESTSIGLQVLLQMSSNLPAGAGNPQTLLSFLRTIAHTAPHPINLYVTGHSLGGCLAGTLGLYLKEQAPQWGGRGVASISCVTFAAPTAGNQQFATYSDASFQVANRIYRPNWDGSQGSAFDAVCCSFDIAPLGWVASNISNSTTYSPIFDLYDNGQDFWNHNGLNFNEMETPYDDAWGDIVLAYILPDAASALSANNYTRLTPGPALAGAALNTDFFIYDDNFENTFNCFIQQATYQHCQSYPTLLQVPQLLDPSIIVENPDAASPVVRPAAARRQLLVRGLSQLLRQRAVLAADAGPAPARKAPRAAPPATKAAPVKAAPPAKAVKAAKAAKPATGKAANKPGPAEKAVKASRRPKQS